MPIAAPVIASSERGVPKTRSGPYFSSSPRVVPWIDFGSSTSRPNTTTFGSRAISRSAASRTASTKESVRSAAGRGKRSTAFSTSRGDGIGVLLVDVAHEFGRDREGAGPREREGGRDLGVHLGLDAGPLVRGELLPEPAHRVGGDPRLALGEGAVAELVVAARPDV